MRTILIACVALGSAVFASASSAPADAQVVIRAPGIAVESGDPYWRQRHDEAQWRRREEFREAQHNRREWQRDHCVRDWEGRPYCR
jgi:hypothetical protein